MPNNGFKQCERCSDTGRFRDPAKENTNGFVDGITDDYKYEKDGEWCNYDA